MSFDLRKPRPTMFSQGTDFLIGELLLKAGIIKQNQLDDALKLAGNKHMQIGQMLIMARYITPKDLQAALDAQTAIRDKIVDMNGALRALGLVRRSGMTFAEASAQNIQEAGVIPTHKLGQLLLEANLISGEQFSTALQKSMAIGLPLGRILILNNVISEAILSSALDTMIKLRDGTIGREEATAYLSDLSRKKEINELGLSVLEEASLFRTQFDAVSNRGIRLGEFLILSGILSETDVMNALEFALVNEKTLGEMLLEHGYVTRELIDAALKLQSLILTDSMDASRAARSLAYMHTNSVSLNDAIEIINNEASDGSRVDFQTLLLESNLITSEAIQTALELAVSNPRILSRVLTQTGYLSEAQAQLMVDCHDAIVRNAIGLEDAKFVLDFCLQKLVEGPITFVQGLKELGWSPPEQGLNIELEQPLVKASPPIQSSAGSDFMNTVLTSGRSDQSFINSSGHSSFPLMSGQAFSEPPEQAQAPVPDTHTVLYTPAPTPAQAPRFAQSLPPNPNPEPSPVSKPAQALTQSLAQVQAPLPPSPIPQSQTRFPSSPPISQLAAPPEGPTVSPSTNKQQKNHASTTTNMPAITSLQLGSEAMRSLEEGSPINSKQPNTTAAVENTISPGSDQSSITSAKEPVADKPFNLRALLKEAESNGQDGDGAPNTAIEKGAAAASKSKNTNDEMLALSESEKDLIMKASSLTASPQEIMAAMKLAETKEKTIQSHDKDNEK